MGGVLSALYKEMILNNGIILVLIVWADTFSSAQS